MLNVFAIGNLTRDPEKTEHGCRFGIACNAGKDTVDYMTVYAYGNTADACMQYLNKGNKVAVTGRMHFYISESGDNVYLNGVINATTIDFLSTQKTEQKEESEHSGVEKRSMKRFSK